MAIRTVLNDSQPAYLRGVEAPKTRHGHDADTGTDGDSDTKSRRVLGEAAYWEDEEPAVVDGGNGANALGG